jgi:hypothetical protein
MPVRREAKMKKIVLIALIMVLGLGGCVCSGTCVLIKQDWTDYWNNPGGRSWESIKQDWTDYWN